MRKTILGLLLGTVLLGALRWIDLHPLRFEDVPDDPQYAGIAAAPSEAGEIELVVDHAAIARRSSAGTHVDLDLSIAWANLLEAEVGPHRVVEVADHARPAARAVVVTSSALPAVTVEQVETWTSSGAAVLLDAPDAGAEWPAALLELAGLGPGATPWPREGLLPPGAVAAADARAFDAAPFARTSATLGLRSIDAATRAAGSLFFERPLGPGRVIVARTSIARLFATMVQGAPATGADGFELVERHGDYEGLIEPDDLVADPRLRENELPFADLLARAVVSLLDPTPWPLCRVFWFPAGARGLHLVTHDEDLKGGADARWLARWDQELGQRGTIFVVSHPRLPEDWTAREDHAAAVVGFGGAIGLHWNQLPMPHGIGPFEPIARVASCAEQAERLRDLSPATRGFTSNRNHFLVLRDTWAKTFRVLAAQGVRIDSTFGSNKGRGYLFGTARPYRAIDENGFLLPIRELPFVNQEDWGGADAAYFTRLFETNAARHRGAIVTLFHPHLILLEDAGKRLFEHVAETATATGHRAMNFDELLGFVDARASARVRGEASDGGLDVYVEVARDDFLLGFPWRGALPRATIDGVAAEVERLELGATHVAVRLPAGRHSVRWTR